MFSLTLANPAVRIKINASYLLNTVFKVLAPVSQGDLLRWFQYLQIFHIYESQTMHYKLQP